MITVHLHGEINFGIFYVLLLLPIPINTIANSLGALEEEVGYKNYAEK